VLATGVLVEPAHGAAPTATAEGLGNFALAVGTGLSAPTKVKNLNVAFTGAADASVEFQNQKADSAGNVIAGTSPVNFQPFGSENTPCAFKPDGFCHLDPGQTDAHFDLEFESNSAVEAFAKFTYTLRDGTTVLHTGSILISVLDGPDVGDVFPRQTFSKTCPRPGGTSTPACKVGDDLDFTVQARNVGSDPIIGLRVRFEFSSGIKPTPGSSGSPAQTCATSKGPSTHITVVICELPNTTLEPRQLFKFDLDPNGPEGTIGSDAFGDEEVCFEVTPLQDTSVIYPDSGPCQLGNVGVLSGASALKREPDIDPQDNWGWVAIKGVKTQVIDLAAIGANAHGGIGDEVSVQVGIANRGTGSIDTYRTKQPASRITVTIPNGIQVTTPGVGCTDQTSYWLCSQPGSFLGAGQSFMYAFKLKIVSTSPSGEVSVREPGVETRDGNPDNDLDALRVGEGLPKTGQPTIAIVATGAALLVAGTLLLRFIPRRRRRPFP
jgi:LPXTG-motif cell wall-anchored protein